jgi:hypothetical protein
MFKYLYFISFINKILILTKIKRKNVKFSNFSFFFSISIRFLFFKILLISNSYIIFIILFLKLISLLKKFQIFF